MQIHRLYIVVGGTAGNISSGPVAQHPTMPFRLDGQQFFLTYPHSEFDHDQLYQFLCTLEQVLWARIATEQHESGEPHVHAVFKFSKRWTSRNERVFDYEGRHPNIQSVRSATKSLDYLSKGGQFTDYGTIPSGGPRATAGELLELAKSASEADYWVACAEARLPYQYAQRFRSMASSEAGTTLTEWTGQTSWMRLDLQCIPLPSAKSIVLVGPSGCGKTTWVKSHCPKPALWVRHIDVLRSFRPDYHKSIVFDDMSFCHMPPQAQIHLVDWQDTSHIHCRYGHATIPEGTLRFFTCNVFPFTTEGPEAAAIARRIHQILL